MPSTQTNKPATHIFIYQRLSDEESHSTATMGPNIISIQEVPCTTSAGMEEEPKYMSKTGWVTTDALQPLRCLAGTEVNKYSTIVAKSR
jgi:hypothetical protein